MGFRPCTQRDTEIKREGERTVYLVHQNWESVMENLEKWSKCPMNINNLLIIFIYNIYA